MKTLRTVTSETKLYGVRPVDFAVNIFICPERTDLPYSCD